jgi:hypothetical protein
MCAFATFSVENMYSRVIFSILGDVEPTTYEKYGARYVYHLQHSAIPCTLGDIRAGHAYQVGRSSPRLDGPQQRHLSNLRVLTSSHNHYRNSRDLLKGNSQLS